jgi:multicomponent K+:H+ antiporter subunit D
MAQLAERLAALPADDRVLAEAGAGVLAVAFLVKAGMWPLGFWLPPTYAAASAPAAALFSILSKVGVYALLRLWLLLFGGTIGADLLFYGGVATLAFGAIGMLASQELGRLGGYSVLVSSGTLLAALSRADEAVTGAGLFYLVASTLGIATFFLLAELVQRSREPGADILAVTAEAFDVADDDAEPEEQPGSVIPAAIALLGLSFACCALLIAGLPPLPGFVAKLSLLAGVLAPEPIEGAAWALLALLPLSGLAAIISMGRAGVRIFWAAEERSLPRVRVVEMAPVGLLLALAFALTIAAGPAMQYLHAAAAALHAPQTYIRSVLPAP